MVRMPAQSTRIFGKPGKLHNFRIMDTQKTGTLYGIGVGPGDPELLTIKAERILKSVRTVFTAASNGAGESWAARIAAPHIGPDSRIIPLYFPMKRDRKTLELAWRQNSKEVLDVLNRPEPAAFITLGDPSTYSTFTYLIRHLREMQPSIPIQVIPGITSYQAAAARLVLPLAEGEQSLAICSGARGGQEIEGILKTADNIVVLKAYRRFQSIVEVLKERSLLKNCVAVRHCGLPDESITWDIENWDGDKPSYFTLLLVKKQAERKKLENARQ